MMARQKGIVLITVLMFVSLISLLVMMNLMNSGLQRQMNANTRFTIRNFLVAQAGLEIAYRALNAGDRRCILLKPMSSYHLLMKTQMWWHSGISCHSQFDHRKIQYVIEPLGVDSCATLDKVHSVQYYRITVRAESSNDDFAETILQGTVVYPYYFPMEKCEKGKRELSGIWQSWRQLA